MVTDGRGEMSKSRRVSITSVMTALALVGNYVLIAIPNVEFGTTVLFVTAFTFGIHMGFWVTIIMSLIFGLFNPWGPFIPQIWITQVIGWLFVVLAGGTIRRSGYKEFKDPHYRGMLAFIGFLVTLFYDLVTNLGVAWVTGNPYWFVLVTGSLFLIVHTFSNAVLFALVVPDLQRIIHQDLGHMIWQPSIIELGEE